MTTARTSALAGVLAAGTIAALALAGSPDPDLPDPQLTPGATNPDVRQDTIAETICVKGWTATIRPSRDYTDPLKLAIIKDYNLAGSRGNYQFDHLIPLELGGHPTDPANLWPEHWRGTWGAHTKDQLENRLKALVCSHAMTLDDAQSMIRQDWKTAYCVVFHGDARC